MKQLTFLLLCVGMLFGASQASAQTADKSKGGPNADVKESTFKVYGNCGMCKKTIEKSANQNPTLDFLSLFKRAYRRGKRT